MDGDYGGSVVAAVVTSGGDGGGGEGPGEVRYSIRLRQV
jgi:hypothetical protein